MTTGAFWISQGKKVPFVFTKAKMHNKARIRVTNRNQNLPQWYHQRVDDVV